jgi:hypothetical protein
MRQNPKDRQTRPTPEQIRALQEAADAHAKEVVSHIYRAMLKTPAFTLLNGTTCRVESYYEPEVNSEGDLKCGIDVRMEDGSHLEFTVGHTGWGKAIANSEDSKQKGKQSGRRP